MTPKLSQEIYDADFCDLLEFAEAYAALGEAVSSQVSLLLEGEYDAINPNAVKLISDKLRGVSGELDDALEDYAAWRLEDESATEVPS